MPDCSNNQMWQIIQLLIFTHILPPVGGNEEIERGARGSPAPDDDHDHDGYDDDHDGDVDDNHDDDNDDDHRGGLKPFSLSWFQKIKMKATINHPLKYKIWLDELGFYPKSEKGEIGLGRLMRIN